MVHMHMLYAYTVYYLVLVSFIDDKNHLLFLCRFSIMLKVFKPTQKTLNVYWQWVIACRIVTTYSLPCKFNRITCTKINHCTRSCIFPATRLTMLFVILYFPYKLLLLAVDLKFLRTYTPKRNFALWRKLVGSYFKVTFVFTYLSTK